MNLKQIYFLFDKNGVHKLKEEVFDISFDNKKVFYLVQDKYELVDREVFENEASLHFEIVADPLVPFVNVIQEQIQKIIVALDADDLLRFKSYCNEWGVPDEKIDIR